MTVELKLNPNEEALLQQKLSHGESLEDILRRRPLERLSQLARNQPDIETAAHKDVPEHHENASA